MGSNLGPDSATIVKYVDDAKLIKGLATEAYVEELQADLEALYSWQRENNMEWNALKFVDLRLGPCCSPQTTGSS
jgi:hypothetical protein